MPKRSARLYNRVNVLSELYRHSVEELWIFPPIPSLITQKQWLQQWKDQPFHTVQERIRADVFVDSLPDLPLDLTVALVLTKQRQWAYRSQATHQGGGIIQT